MFSLQLYIIYINDITLTLYFQFLTYLFRILSVVSNLEPRCVVKQIGDFFLF